MLIKFSETGKVKGIPMSKNDIDNLKGIMKNRTHVNHSHISGEIIGYAHRYCNYKVRENQTKISVVAHNLFRFDFFFLLKGLRTGVRKTKDITIDGKNPSLVQLSALFRKISPPLKYSRLQILGIL